MKTAIVSGITGQDGSILAHKLLQRGYLVVGLKRRSSVFNTERIDDIYAHPDFKVEYFDLHDAASINRVIAAYKPDEFYNLAAQSHVRVSFDVPEDTLKGIVLGTLYILEAIKNISPATKLYQASSSEMYGDNPNYPYTEESEFRPVSPYAIAKVAAHNLVACYRKAYNLFACCGILFNHESETRHEAFVTRKISVGAARIALGKQAVIELGNIEACRDWGYAPEYVEAMILMLHREEPEDFVIATGETHSVVDFIQEVFTCAGLGNCWPYIRINPIYYRSCEVPYLVGCYDKAKQKLGWEPKVKFKDLARKMYDYDYRRLSGDIR